MRITASEKWSEGRKLYTFEHPSSSSPRRFGGTPAEAERE